MTRTILFIALVAAVAAGHSMLVAAQHLPLPPLKYAYDALEPHLDAENLRVHHQKHHQSYTNSLNDALAALRADVRSVALSLRWCVLCKLFVVHVERRWKAAACMCERERQSFMQVR